MPASSGLPSPRDLAAPVLRPLRALRRRVLLHRRPLAALCAAAAVLLGLQAAAAPPPTTTRVLTAAHDLPGGTVLSTRDLETTRVPPETVPDRVVTDRRDLVGRTLATPMTRGETMTELRTVTADLLRGYPASTAVPVRVSDGAVVDLLRVGDRITLTVADPDGEQPPALVADDVPVLAIPRATRGGGFETDVPGRLVLVAVPRLRAAEVAARAVTGFLIVTWDR